MSMERTTFGLLFYIRRTKLNKSGEASIFLCITVVDTTYLCFVQIGKPIGIDLHSSIVKVDVIALWKGSAEPE